MLKGAGGEKGFNEAHKTDGLNLAVTLICLKNFLDKQSQQLTAFPMMTKHDHDLDDLRVSKCSLINYLIHHIITLNYHN